MSTRIEDRLPLPSQERLRELFDYDAERGLLVWKQTLQPRRRIKAGDAAGGISKCSGRRMVRVDYVAYRHARLVYCYHKSDPGGWQVDHRDRNPQNDRIENLRLASGSENTRNTGLRSDNTSGYKGVSWDRERRKWLAKIKLSDRQLALGRFDRIEDAVKARKQAEQKYFGEFAA